MTTTQPRILLRTLSKAHARFVAIKSSASTEPRCCSQTWTSQPRTRLEVALVRAKEVDIVCLVGAAKRWVLLHSLLLLLLVLLRQLLLLVDRLGEMRKGI